jgi:hypothetical protein
MGRFSDLKIINEPSPRPEAIPIHPEPKPKRVGKRDHPDYTQISVYIRKQPYHEAKRKLIGSDQDFSDLVNDLVASWLLKDSGSAAS